MNKVAKFFKSFYIHIILLAFYIPLLYAAIFSFNNPSSKGFVRTSWNGFTTNNWATFFNEGRGIALLNSLVIAFAVSVIVVTISLFTCYGMWRQKNRIYSKMILGTNNVPLINPDNISAIGLALLFSVLFGTLANTREGLFRGIVGHTVMALPYAITLMFPRSDKFNASLFEAAQDLGYSKLRAWFKTYFVYMLPSSFFAAIVAAFLSFDDFIILRTVSNTSTLGTKLYEGEFRAWGLVVGASLLIIVLSFNAIYISYKWIKIARANKKAKKSIEQANKEEIETKTSLFDIGGTDEKQ
ncbi:ABC transporter permease [Mycoplasmopsis agalactiae]|uniref:ABC transporter permease n=1 Tax=Mycoplasmopsis agalactiae TaxID=2110 RepID=UPI001F3CD399|nr:ABC transporter permease [Mycoplasmopsis agalactiae]MCE6115003.1 ABC transporter permease [Mycoplasmopsis agalactiae]